MKAPFATIGCALLLVLGVPAAQTAAGDLDPDFGSGGLMTTDFGGRRDFSLGVALQADGRIVVAGNSGLSDFSSTSFALARYEADGSLDEGFGNQGTVLTTFGVRSSSAADLAVQPDGKIVAVGTAGGDFAVARYTASGTPDPTFGTDGLVRTDLGGVDQANGVVLQPDGKIVVAGLLIGSLAVARYNPDGSLDLTFGSGGTAVTTPTPLFNGAFDVALTPDGRIVVAGSTGLYPSTVSDFLLLRYTADGSPDPSFGNGGIVTTDFGGSDGSFALRVSGSGTIIAVGGTQGSAQSDIALARYLPDGSLDATFGTAGKVTTDFGSGSNDTAEGIVVHASGRITVAGFTTVESGTAFAVVRYTPTGVADGKASATFGNPINNAFDIALQPDGKVVVAGGTIDQAQGITDFALARFVGGASPLKVVVDVRPDSSVNVIPLQSNGVVPVAIITTNSFDAATVDPATVCFGRDCTEKHGVGHREDVNGDGRLDLLLHYETAETGIVAGDTRICLTGKTYSGTAIEGCDSIVTNWRIATPGHVSWQGPGAASIR
jgi:uncharacterized delta-60 repeat protein